MPRHFDTILRIRVTQAERRALEAVAVENHKTVSTLLREATNEYVADYRENAEVFRKRRTAPDS